MEADAVDGGDWPAITPSSPPANWEPRGADGTWVETRIERFTCHHRWGRASSQGEGGLAVDAAVRVWPSGAEWEAHQGPRRTRAAPAAAAAPAHPPSTSRHCAHRPPPANSHTRAASAPASGRGWAACAWSAPAGPTTRRRCSWPPRGSTWRRRGRRTSRTPCESTARNCGGCGWWKRQAAGRRTSRTPCESTARNCGGCGWWKRQAAGRRTSRTPCESTAAGNGMRAMQCGRRWAGVGVGGAGGSAAGVEPGGQPVRARTWAVCASAVRLAPSVGPRVRLRSPSQPPSSCAPPTQRISRLPRALPQPGGLLGQHGGPQRRHPIPALGRPNGPLCAAHAGPDRGGGG